jgi:AbrB family looped-hinge helix DNA binding protein
MADPRLIDGQWRVAIPPDVRKALGLQRGDHVVFEVEGKGVKLYKAQWKTIK